MSTPNLRINLWPVGRGSAVQWEWLVVIGHDSATGERPSLLEALGEATEAMKRIAADKAQMTVTLGPGTPGVDTCDVEGCGKDPDVFGNGGCVDHEMEGR